MTERFKEMKEKIDAYFESDKGKLYFENLKIKQEREERIGKRHLMVFHDKFSERFEEILEKIVTKYESDEYHNKWMHRGYMPPEPLYFFLHDYAIEYGRECTEEEWENYGNMFTGDLRFVKGYYFNVMHGQGTVVKVMKGDDYE